MTSSTANDKADARSRRSRRQAVMVAMALAVGLGAAADRPRGVAVSAGGAPEEAAKHVLTGGELQEALRLARDRGFGFASRTTDEGRCEVHPVGWDPAGTREHTLVAKPISHGVGGDASRQVCEFDLLTGRRLADGWLMLDVRLGSVHVQLGDEGRSGARFSRTPAPQSPDPSFIVWVGHFGTRAPGPSDRERRPFTAVAIERIRLLGPTGEDWREAFR